MDTPLSLAVRLAVLALTLIGWLSLYFFVNRMEVNHKNRLGFDLPVDREIPFIPQFALLYFSTYGFVLIPFVIVSDARPFYWMAASFIAISVISSLIHATVPSKIERVEDLNTEGLNGWMLGLFQKTCKPYGNFPSMHVGLSVPVIGSTYLAAGPVAGTLVLIWGVLIAVSTLYTKQHYILDVLAGVLGGLVIYGVMFWLVMA